MTNKEPILLLLYNRPDFAKKQLTLLLKTCPTHQIYISVDGSKKNSKNDVLAVTKIVKSFKSRFDNDLVIRLSKKNLGCKLGVQSAIDWFFEYVDRGIILEDDCIPDPTFFKYASILLKKYKHDNRIGMISGTNPFIDSKLDESYFFSNQSIIWGWATWKNRWQNYHQIIENSDEIINNQELNNYLRTKTSHKHLKIFEKVMSNKIDTWDFIWYITNILYSRYCIIPNTNLISNIGFEVNPTHTHIKTDQANLKIIPLEFPLCPPLFYNINTKFEKKYLNQIKTHNLIISILKAKISG